MGRGPSRVSQAALFAFTLFSTTSAGAAEYICSVTKKGDSERQYTSEELSELQFTNRVEEAGEQAWVSRCSFTRSAGSVTCDRLLMEHVAVDPVVKIKKYYMFSSQFDFQLFPDLRFVENNGRGGVAYGTCSIVAP